MSSCKNNIKKMKRGRNRVGLRSSSSTKKSSRVLPVSLACISIMAIGVSSWSFLDPSATVRRTTKRSSRNPHKSTVRRPSLIRLQLLSQYEDDVEDDDDDDDISVPPNQQELKQELGQLFQMPQSNHIEYDFDDLGPSYFPMAASALTVEDLEAYLEERKKSHNSTNNNIHQDYLAYLSENDDDEYTMRLDSEAYMQAGDLIGPDGSLSMAMVTPPPPSSSSSSSNTFMNNQRRQRQQPLPPDMLPSILWSAPDSPDVTSSQSDNNNNDKNNVTMETLWEVMQNLPSSANNNDNNNNTATSESLHNQVFANEQGFLNQSRVFVESLTDPSQLDDAWLERRRNTAWQQRQEAAIKLLDEQMEEMMEIVHNASVAQENNRMGTSKGVDDVRCSKCQCRLDPTERRFNEGRRTKTCQVCHADELVEQSRASSSRPGGSMSVTSKRSPPKNSWQQQKQQQSQASAAASSDKAPARRFSKPSATTTSATTVVPVTTNAQRPTLTTDPEPATPSRSQPKPVPREQQQQQEEEETRRQLPPPELMDDSYDPYDGWKQSTTYTSSSKKKKTPPPPPPPTDP